MLRSQPVVADRRADALRTWLWVAAAGLTGFSLVAAFPPLGWSQLVWIAWVPVLLVALRSPPREAMRCGLLAGVIFWLGALFWLRHVTWTGWFLLSVYCAVYTTAFTGLAAGLARERDATRLAGRLTLLVMLPLVWAGLEMLRAVLFTGFAWNPLGGSQYRNIALIQVAAWTGVYGVSALIILLNTALALTVQRYLDGRGWRRGPHVELMLSLLVLALAVGGGARRARATGAQADGLRLAVIQPNIPQYEKWSDESVDQIYETLDRLTALAIRAIEPDLVIWPETALPDYVRESQPSYELVKELVTQGAPLLVGSMDIGWADDGTPRYYNSSLLFDTGGGLVEVYDKQHLVMFGEYVPLEQMLPFIQALSPFEASFDPGDQRILFELDEGSPPFAVLICFEDTVARLARLAVQDGARWLVNQTNVAWFKQSGAAWQHVTHSVFRAVENGVPLVRAANTGVSCGIDRHGRIHNLLADGTDGIFIEGFGPVTLHPTGPDADLTYYTRHGDVFGWTGVMAALMAALALIPRRPGARAADDAVPSPPTKE